jgi:hypothetical protein
MFPYKLRKGKNDRTTEAAILGRGVLRELIVCAHIVKNERGPQLIREAIDSKVEALGVCQNVLNVVSIEVGNDLSRNLHQG